MSAGLRLALPLLARTAFAQIYADTLPLDHPAIRYFKDAPSDPVARLKGQLEGVTSLSDLLHTLDINIDTQALVFSKTSFQSTKISPRNPRAIYFNDEVAVGYVPGGDGYEIASLDPKQGVIFYFLSANRPRLTRRDECMHCHQGPSTFGGPGMFIGSVFPGPTGMPDRSLAIITDHRTPFADRWGGWYVNAAAGQQKDRSNAVASDPAEPHTLEKLRPFAAVNYLAPTSDIIALMTFEHQTQAANLITRLGWRARMSLPVDDDINALVRYMTFADEAPLAEPIKGASTFTETFPQRGPRDSKGRSLRDFDLQTRVFRYPLSYMIYSPAFEALPDAIRAAVYQKLKPQVSPAILDILRETKPDFPR